jgi:tetratricopeptide (TPR) repeat protein
MGNRRLILGLVIIGGIAALYAGIYLARHLVLGLLRPSGGAPGGGAAPVVQRGVPKSVPTTQPGTEQVAAPTTMPQAATPLTSSGQLLANLPAAMLREPTMRLRGQIESAMAILADRCRRSPQYWRTLAKLALDNGRCDEAEGYLRQALRLDPKSAATHIGFGLIEVNRRPPRLPQAEEWLRKAVDLAPNDPEALYNLGVVQHRQQHFHDAEKSYLRVVATQPENYHAWFNLAGIATYYGRLIESRSLWEKVVQLRPESSEGRYQLGLTYLQLKMPDEAITQFEIVRKSQPNDADVLNNLALAWQAKNEEDRALSLFEQARELDRGNVTIMNNLADLHLVLHQRTPQESKHLDEAMRLWQSSLRLKPDQPRVANFVKFFKAQEN